MRAWIALLTACALASASPLDAQEPGRSDAMPSASVLEQDIRDIKGPVEIAVPRSSPWIPLVLGALAAGGLGFAAFRLARRARRLTPVDAARASFARARSSISEARCRELAYTVSETVRQFLERRLGLPASRETTEEFLWRLGTGAAPFSDEQRTAFAGFLGACDLAKFSGWQMGPAQMTDLLESGANLVEAIEKEQAP